MENLVIEHTTPMEQIIHTKDFTSYKSFVIAGLEDRLLHGIYNYLKDLKEGEYLVISRPEFVEASLPIFGGMITRLQAKVEVIAETPYYITTLCYKGQEIKPIESLSFIERLKFLFTGIYPE